jgi:anhydro-N-acetylmuramic acid kinase
MNMLGVMSGTSMDGLDLAVCSFSETGGHWSYRILHTETVGYKRDWMLKLDSAPHLSGPDLLLLDREYGQFIATHASAAIQAGGIGVDGIASHGHTIFHQPSAAFTFQLGNPQVIAAQTGIKTVGDFRQLDILHGGQGAPLVPFGDEYLFGEYEQCLNLGGFANISFKSRGKRLARDVCPSNTVLNRFARELELPYDKGGKAGRSGNLSIPLLEKLNALSYYAGSGPGSLSREWVEAEFLPRVNEFRLPVTDILRTLTEHIAFQVAAQIKPHSRVLATGGGAYNDFLVQRIREHSRADVVIPDARLVEFKEALVFAFLGLLRLRGEINCYAGVTGAGRDSCCGVVFLP